MRDVYDFAKFFIKNGADSRPNTYDGNMKLQKLLVLADLASIAEYGEPLFIDQVLAFKNGCVVEKVRLRYKNDYVAFRRDSEAYQPDFSEREYEVLKLVMEIFGCASAKELSDINHTFNFWKLAFDNGTSSTGYHNKEMSVVDMMSQDSDVERMREIISAYRETVNDVTAYDRPYLVVTAEPDYIEVLNVSSIRGKERKLAFPTNERLRTYNPPFVMPSFVKLDSLTRVESADWGNLQVLNSGRTLDGNELARIKGML